MTKRSIAGGAIVALLALLAGGRVEVSAQGGKLPRVGFLTPQASTPASLGAWSAFRDGMRQLGWVDGQNVRYEFRSAEGKLERLPELASELVSLSVDLIVAVNTPGSLAPKRATAAIPIVMVQVGDPVAVGLVTNLARPGGNLTGFTNLTGEITTKRVELLAQVLPRPTRIALVANPDDPLASVQIKDAEAAARQRDVETRVFQVRKPEDLDPAFRAILQWRAAGALRLVDPLMWLLGPKTFELAIRHRLPMMHAFRTEAERGALMTYGADALECFTRAPEYVDKILKGARAGELPVQRATRLEFVINLKTAQAIGLTIGPNVRARADAVIE